MKGIPIQLQGVISFIDTTLESKTLSQTYQCYLLNLEKATLDTLKVANIAFESLDAYIPIDVRQMFQRTTVKIKELIKNKPKGQLQKQQRYYSQQYDELQDFLDNRPEIYGSNTQERGELFKFLNQVEQKQKQNKLLLQNIPKFSYGTTRHYAKQHKTYFSDSSMNNKNEVNAGQVRTSQIIQDKFDKQEKYETLKDTDKMSIQRVKGINEAVQTDLTLNLLTQMFGHIDDKKITGQLLQIVQKQIKSQQQNNCQNKNNSLTQKNQKQKLNNNDAVPQDVEDSLNVNKKLKKNFSRKQSTKEYNIEQTALEKEREQTEAKIKQQLANIQNLELQKVEIKNQQVLVKGFIKNKKGGKKQIKSKKNDNTRRGSIVTTKNKNVEEILSNNQKKKNAPRQSIDKSESILQKLNKTKNKENMLADRNSKNTLRASQIDLSQEKKFEKSTQTQNTYEMQAKKVNQTNVIGSNTEVTSQNLTNKQKSCSLHKMNSQDELQKQLCIKSKQAKSNQTQKVADNNNSKQTINDQHQSITNARQKRNQEGQINENSKNKKHASIHQITQEIKGESESGLPSLSKNSRFKKYQILTNNMPNFSLTNFNNFKQSGEQKQLKKTKSNFSQFHQSMHINSSQYRQQKHNNQSLNKKDLQRSLQSLPAIRQEQQNQVYNNREKVLSKGKAEILEKQNKRLLDQIQEGTSLKKGKNVEWMKVIRDIRQYEHLHFKYCGDNCVHLNKFYEFLKKKNLSMYINRKQLYVHKHNIEIKPALI